MNMTQSRYGLKFYIYFLLLLFSFMIRVEWTAADQAKRVLILNSYHKGFEWTDSQVSAAKEVLLKKFENIEIFIEYMDTKRIYNEDYLVSLRNLYRLKYKDLPIDAIIATDDNALSFALNNQKAIFNNVPVSFCGINDYKKQFAQNSQATGIIEVLDIEATTELALSLHPNTKNIVVVVDSTPTGAGQLKDIHAASRQFPDLQFTYLKGNCLSNAELFAKLGSLPEKSIVLLALWLRDKNHAYLSPHKGGPLISQTASAPVYGIIDMYFGKGIIGGKLLNSQTQGRIAAEKACQLINGTKASNIPIIQTSTNSYMFDYEQLKRWGIELSSLPEESKIIKKPFSVYEEYKKTIYIISGVFAFLVLTVLALSFNIASRKKAEKELGRSEEKFRNVFREHAAVKLLIDPDTGNIIEANKAAEKFYGWSLEQLKNMRIQDINMLSPEQVAMEMEKSRSLLKNHFEFRHQIANGSIRDVEVYSSLISIEQDGKEVLHSIIHDVTSRKIAERELQASEARFRAITENTKEITLILDPEDHYAYISPAIFDATGYAADEIIGKKPDAFLHEEDYKAFRQCRTNAIDSPGESFLMPEFRLIHKKGNWVPFEGMLTSMIDVAGVNGLVINCRNMTEHKKLETQLYQAQKMEAIGTLAGGIAHDFNNILSSVIGYTDLGLEQVESGTLLHSNLSEVMIAGNRAKDLVCQILAMSRHDEQEKIPVPVAPLVKEAMKMLRSTIPTSINFKENITNAKLIVYGDPTQIHQVIMNLATNALHAMSDMEGTFAVSVQETSFDVSIDEKYLHIEQGNYAHITVSDTGVGIPASQLEKIFEPYFTTKEKGQGTGLGLAVVHGIVKSHNGDIRVYSEPGAGTTFHVYFPLAESRFIELPDQKAEPLPTGSESILVIDDEIPIAKMHKQSLESLGYHVTLKTSSLEALEAFRALPQNFDLILTDMTMPYMTGEKLVSAVKIIRPDIPVVLCTGFSERVNEHGKGLEIDRILMKPINKKQMAETVRKLLDARDI